MKRLKQTLAILAFGVALQSCASMGSNKLFSIQKGMTKEEVSQVLGKPGYRRFDEHGEQWEYRKSGGLGRYTTTVLVDFADGRVTNLDSFEGQPILPAVAVCPPAETKHASLHQPPMYTDRDHSRFRAMNEDDFRQLYNEVKNKPFKDDQLDILGTGAINNRFTCAQCIRMMSIYTFDDDKLKVLEIMADRITDRENYGNVIESFTFLSGRDKAKGLLSRPVRGAMNSNDFQRLYNQVKSTPFNDDKLEVLASGINRNRLSCKQCVRLMSIYNFDDDKLKVLEVIVGHIADGENYEEILASLSFISSRDKAKKILGISKKW